MAGTRMTRTTWLAGGSMAGVAAVAVWLAWPDDDGRAPAGAAEEARAPAMTAAAATEGRAAFDRHCAVCHGAGAAGSDRGPPLVHRIYEPGHHADAAFRRAVRHGVRAHHWPFGDMPPVDGVSERDVTLIIEYVRGLQRAHGIE